VCILDDDTSYRATVICEIQYLNAETHANIKFLVDLGDDEFDEIIAYGTLYKCIYDLEDEDVSPEDKVWTFKDNFGHQGPLK
jgi:hypothetical protein